MMDLETQKIIEDRFKLLPENIQMAIVSAEYKTKLQEITQRQRLLIDQAGKLEMETTLVMIGLEPLADFVENIQRELGVNVIRAREISMDVSEHIFKPIRESLQALNEEGIPSADGEDEVENKPEEIRHTDIEDHHLSREQVLSEIEDPSLIKGGQVAKPTMALETLAEIPYQQDIKVKKVEAPAPAPFIQPDSEALVTPVAPKPEPSIMETQMAGMTISTKQVVEATPEVKLPPIEKKRPSSGFDPYRESLS
jgi:hypothetical protein